MIIKIKEGGEIFYYNAESKDDAVKNHIRMTGYEIQAADIDSVEEVSEEAASKLETADEFGKITNLLKDSKETTDEFGLIASTI